MQHCADGNQRELSRRSGLRENHVGTILTRLRKNPGADIERETLAAIASGGLVSVHWLATGQGPRRVDDGTGAPADAGDVAAPRFENVANWPALRATAKAIDPGIEDWALDMVAQSNPLLTAPLTAGMVADLAKVVMKHVPPPGRRP